MKPDDITPREWEAAHDAQKRAVLVGTDLVRAALVAQNALRDRRVAVDVARAERERLAVLAREIDLRLAASTQTAWRDRPDIIVALVSEARGLLRSLTGPGEGVAPNPEPNSQAPSLASSGGDASPVGSLPFQTDDCQVYSSAPDPEPCPD